MLAEVTLIIKQKLLKYHHPESIWREIGYTVYLLRGPQLM